MFFHFRERKKIDRSSSSKILIPTTPTTLPTLWDTYHMSSFWRRPSGASSSGFSAKLLFGVLEKQISMLFPWCIPLFSLPVAPWMKLQQQGSVYTCSKTFWIYSRNLCLQSFVLTCYITSTIKSLSMAFQDIQTF